MHPEDHALLKKMLGLSDQASLPKAVIEAYGRWRQMWHRVASGALCDIGGHVLLPIADAANADPAVNPTPVSPAPAPGNSVAKAGFEPRLLEPGTPVLASGRAGKWMGYKDGTTRVQFGPDEEVRGVPLEEISLIGKPAAKPAKDEKDDIPPTNDILTPSPPLGTGLIVDLKGKAYQAEFNGRMANGMVKVKIPERPKTRMVSIKAVQSVVGPEDDEDDNG